MRIALRVEDGLTKPFNHIRQTYTSYRPTQCQHSWYVHNTTPITSTSSGGSLGPEPMDLSTIENGTKYTSITKEEREHLICQCGWRIEPSSWSSSPPFSYAQAAQSAAPVTSGRRSALQLPTRHSDSIIYDHLPSEISPLTVAHAFMKDFSLPAHFYELPDFNRNLVLKLQSATEVSTVLATPLEIQSHKISLAARRLATSAEMARFQVLQLRDVPLLLTPEIVTAVFTPAVAPYEEIVELQRDIDPLYPLLHNGQYRLVVRLTDVRKPATHALVITHKAILTKIPVRLDSM
ncbi:hypothetical protein V1514DRAFT_319203 [Lipomyces japonicus]|uniref:uncharacterized protein n=1 Tax=Lipomyces japonicus TaxID=56871 RepID=UPI0034CE362F